MAGSFPACPAIFGSAQKISKYVVCVEEVPQCSLKSQVSFTTLTYYWLIPSFIMDGSNGSNCLPESPKEEMDTKQTIDDHNPRSEGTLVTAEEFDITIRVLKTLSKPENKKIYDSQPFRPLRQALQPFFNAQKSQMFSGLTPAEHSAKQFNKRRMAQDRYNKILEDEKNLKRTMLRAGRLKRLEEIGNDKYLIIRSHSLFS